MGGALKLPKDQMAMLINADLFACGIATLVQSIGFWRFGIRLPVMMGVTFAAVSPMVVMATNPEIGLLGIYGAVIAAGLFGILFSPLISRCSRSSRPSYRLDHHVLGISLMRVGVNWAAGVNPIDQEPADANPMIANPAYGAPLHLAVAGIVLVFILLITKFVKGFFANIAVLLGLVVGMIIAIALGKVIFAASPLGLVRRRLPLPVRHADVRPRRLPDDVHGHGRRHDRVARHVPRRRQHRRQGRHARADLSDGLRVDGLGTLIGGVFNTFPYTSFSQNVGLVGVTGVQQPLGLRPRRRRPARPRPRPEARCHRRLGPAVRPRRRGSSCSAWSARPASGSWRVDFAKNRLNLYVVAFSPRLRDDPARRGQVLQPDAEGLSPLLHSGILLCSIVAVALNAFFNHLQGAEAAASESQQASAKTEA